MSPTWPHARTFAQRAFSMENAADYVLRKTGVQSPAVDVDLVITRLGVTLAKVENPGWSGATHSDRKRGVAKIWVDSTDAHTRQRFTLAHELGHLLLHDGPRFRDASFNGTPEETQANRFAAALLMPFWLLQPYAPLARTSVDELATIFDVSPRAMKIRLAEMYGSPVDW